MHTPETSKAAKHRLAFEFAITIISILYVGYVVYFILTFFAAPARATIGIVVLSCLLVVLNNLKNSEKAMESRWYLITGIFVILILISIGIYFYSEYPKLIFERDGVNNNLDYFYGALAVVSVIILAWVSFGYIMPVIVIIFVLYGIFGNYLPGRLLYHPGIGLERFLRETVLHITGIYGVLPQVGLKYIAIFIIFAAFVNSFGGLTYIIRVARAIAGDNIRFIPQIAVLSSMVFGSFSGSAGANVAGTGSFTIPLMKRHQIPSHVAGGIEAAASAGGQIMPPIMGATAFVMSEFLGMPYSDIVSAGLFPALLFFLTVLVAVYIISYTYIDISEMKSDTMDESQKIDLRFVAEGIPMSIGIGTILFALMAYQIDAMTAGLYGLFAFLIFQILYLFVINKEKQSVVKSLIKDVIGGIKAGATGSAPIIVLLSALGIIVKMLVGSGLSTRLAYSLVDLAGGLMLPTILLVMIVCILFGMAVTTVAAYILTVVVAGPILSQFNIPDLAIHFSIFYFAMLSAITPPVAAIIPIATSISGAGFFQTAWQAMKIGVAKYLLPFYLIFKPDILRLDVDGLVNFIIGAIGLTGITVGLQLQVRKWRNIWLRFLLLVLGALILFAHGYLTSCFAAAVVLAMISVLWYFREKYASGDI